MSIRHAALAACVIVSATVLSGISSAAATGVAPRQPETGAAAAARGAEAQLASAVAVSAVRRCPAASYGAHFYAPGKGKTVALTFDDGPGRTTAAVLRILARYRVPATFFNLGVNVAARPGLARKEVKAGYAMGNHTWDHPRLGSAVRVAASRRDGPDERRTAGAPPTCGRACSGRHMVTTTPSRCDWPTSAGWACGCGRSTRRTGWRTAQGPPTGSTGSSGWPSGKAARSGIPSC